MLFYLNAFLTSVTALKITKVSQRISLSRFRILINSMKKCNTFSLAKEKSN